MVKRPLIRCGYNYTRAKKASCLAPRCQLFLLRFTLSRFEGNFIENATRGNVENNFITYNAAVMPDDSLFLSRIGSIPAQPFPFISIYPCYVYKFMCRRRVPGEEREKENVCGNEIGVLLVSRLGLAVPTLIWHCESLELWNQRRLLSMIVLH